MSKYSKTLGYTAGVSIFAVALATFMQKFYESSLDKCRYIDPWGVDVLAFAAGIYLIWDGFSEIKKHKHLKCKNHLARMTRIGIGFGILALHVLYVVHG